MQIVTEILTYKPFRIVCDKDNCLWETRDYEKLSKAVVEYGKHLQEQHSPKHERVFKQATNILTAEQTLKKLHEEN